LPRAAQEFGLSITLTPSSRLLEFHWRRPRDDRGLFFDTLSVTRRLLDQRRRFVARQLGACR
jgi:hypothetical protein